MLVANKTAEIKIWDTACHSVLIFNGIWQWKLESDSSPTTASTPGRTKFISHVVLMHKCRRLIVLVFTLPSLLLEGVVGEGPGAGGGAELLTAGLSFSIIIISLIVVVLQKVASEGS